MVKKLTINLIYLKFKDTICWTTNYYLVNKQKKHIYFTFQIWEFSYIHVLYRARFFKGNQYSLKMAMTTEAYLKDLKMHFYRLFNGIC